MDVYRSHIELFLVQKGKSGTGRHNRKQVLRPQQDDSDGCASKVHHGTYLLVCPES